MAATASRTEAASLFEGLTPAQRDAVLAAGVRRTFEPGSFVCRQGDPPGDLFYIHDGRLRVSLDADGEEIELTELGPGSFFGEMSGLRNEPRSTTVTALTRASLSAFAPDALERLSANAPEIAAQLWRTILVEVARRLRRANALLLERYRERSKEKDLMHLLVHDLRSPLAVAETGAAQLLERPDRYGALAPPQERVIRRIRRSHALVKQLADEVLEVGRSAAGSVHDDATTVEDVLLEAIPSALARVDAPSLGEGHLADLGTLAQALAPSDIHLDVPADLARAPFRTDRLRLIQILLNLVGNAVKYAPGWLKVSVRREGERLAIAVQDRGAGIPPAFRGSIFERFRQADAKREGVARGFGFGLAAAKVLVESLGGRISVESDTERAPGATFRFEIPWRPA